MESVMRCNTDAEDAEEAAFGLYSFQCGSHEILSSFILISQLNILEIVWQ